MSNLLRTGIILIGLLLTTGCTTAPPLVKNSKNPSDSLCTERDWFEVGRRDGSQGRTQDQALQYHKECPQFSQQFETIYTNGRNAGLVEFCAPDNAFSLGRMDVAYRYVCPATVEGQFLQDYRRGQSARTLEIEGKKLDARIERLSEELSIAEGTSDQQKIHSEIESLRNLRATKERELSQISK